MKRSMIGMALSLLVGCVATDVGNPQDEPARPTETEVEMEAFVETTSAGALILPDGVELTEAWVVTEAIELESCEVDENGDELGEREFEGVTATELLTGISYPASPLFTHEMTDFCTFALDTAPFGVDDLPDGAPSDLTGLSVLVRGRLKDGTTFEVRSDLERSLELEGEIHLEDRRLNQLVVGFAVNTWVSQRELGAVIERPIVVSSDENEDIYDQFEDAFEASARLFVGNTARQPIAD